MFRLRLRTATSSLLFLWGTSAFTPLVPAAQKYRPAAASFGKPPNAAVISPPGVRSMPGGVGSSLAALPFSAASALPFVKRATLCAAVVWLTVNFRRIFSPNSLAARDFSVSSPLPPAAPSCPVIGNNILVGSKMFGAGYFYHKMSKILEHRRIWLYSFMGKPGVVLSGGKRIKDLLNLEFRKDGVENFVLPSGILNADSILAETEKKKHSSLRRLVGAAMTPAMVDASMPNLQEAAERRIQEALEKEGEVIAEEMCTAYTLDVAWQQILGLDLKEEEIPVFKEAMNTWISGFTSPRIILNIYPDSSPSIKAKVYLEKRIIERIENLEKHGPDASTLSGMVFARDSTGEAGEVGGASRKLTRSQIVENSLVLILAGTETSASTLANAMLFMGLSLDIWGKIVEEQRQLKEKHGSPAGQRLVLSREMLDAECPYLEGVVKETMRIKPITSGGPRMTRKTLTVDGYQIPKGWAINWNVLLTHELDPITRLEDGSHMDVRAGFVPERWLDETTRPTEDFIPMGAGPRYCLGSTLAYAEMKVFLAVLAQNVDYRLVSQGTGEGAGEGKKVIWKRLSIIPKAENGVPVVMTPAVVGAEEVGVPGLFELLKKQNNSMIPEPANEVPVVLHPVTVGGINNEVPIASEDSADILNPVEPLYNQTVGEPVLAAY